jgi:hypothetical protein
MVKYEVVVMTAIATEDLMIETDHSTYFDSYTYAVAWMTCWLHGQTGQTATITAVCIEEDAEQWKADVACYARPEDGDIVRVW